MGTARDELPTGTVTFLFSDIEDSTALVQRLGAVGYREVLEQHHRLLRAAFSANGGADRGTQGDAFLVVFHAAPAAVAAAVSAQRALAAVDWPPGVTVRVRMGLHTGDGIPGGDDYVGLDVHRAAKIAAAAHGGQVLISDTVHGLAGAALPDGVTVTNLGEHYLRGLAVAERLYSLNIRGLPSEFPPPRTRTTLAAHLPVRMTSFVGRDDDLVRVQTLLTAHRLVTLVGPGGAGKTSLAVETARLMAAEFADGAWFVPLETVTDPEAVEPAIAGALGLRDAGAVAAGEQLRSNLPERALLVVLDNLEQVSGAAPVLDRLLALAPALTLLVTSRAPLRLSAEQIYGLTPLPVPDRDELLTTVRLQQVPSVRLFVDRARRVLPTFALAAENFEAVAEICRRLDGLPLGLELAAARIPLLGAAGIRDRLARRLPLPGGGSVDTPARQRTLQRTVAWSHDLLDPSSRTLFARLAVFVGGWRAEELHAVLPADSPPYGDPLDGVSALVDQSLVVATQQGAGVRFSMLETIREFADDRFLEDPDRVTVQRRHALTYLAVAEAAAEELSGREQAATRWRLDVERGNMRGALRWAMEAGEVDVALRLASALTLYWILRGEVEEGRTTLTGILDLPGEAVTPNRMRAVESAATLHYYCGDRDRATELYDLQLTLAQRLNDPVGIADALFNLPFAMGIERLSETSWMTDRAADMYASLGEERKLHRARWAQGTAAYAAGDSATADRLWRDAFLGAQKSDDPYYQSLAANSLGASRLRTGDSEGAARWLLEALAIARDVADVAGITVALPVLARALVDLVSPAPAAIVLGAYEALSRRFGIRPASGLESVLGQENPLGPVRERMDRGSFDVALAEGGAMTYQQVVDYIFTVLGSTVLGDVGAREPDRPAGR